MYRGLVALLMVGLFMTSGVTWTVQVHTSDAAVLGMQQGSLVNVSTCTRLYFYDIITINSNSMPISDKSRGSSNSSRAKFSRPELF